MPTDAYAANIDGAVHPITGLGARSIITSTSRTRWVHLQRPLLLLNLLHLHSIVPAGILWEVALELDRVIDHAACGVGRGIGGRVQVADYLCT